MVYRDRELNSAVPRTVCTISQPWIPLQTIKLCPSLKMEKCALASVRFYLDLFFLLMAGLHNILNDYHFFVKTTCNVVKCVNDVLITCTFTWLRLMDHSFWLQLYSQGWGFSKASFFSLFFKHFWSISSKLKYFANLEKSLWKFWSHFSALL